MFTTLRIRFLAGAAVAALLIATGLSFHSVRATAGTADLVTGSIAPILVAAPVASPMPPALAPAASDAFGAALTLVTQRQFTDAYAAAKALPTEVERRTVQWAAIYYGGGDIPYDAVQRFAADAPDFASSVFKTRIEEALIKSAAPGDLLIKTLGGAMPDTLDAQLALARAYVAAGKSEKAAAIAHDIWVNAILDPGSEKRVLDAVGALLTAKDHWARAEHLMMNDRASAVERLLPFLTPGQKSLAIARNAVSRNGKDAKKLLDAVLPAYRDNPVYLFSRAQRARQAELWDDAIAYLNKGKTTDPDAEDWWYERRTLIRQLLAAGDPQRAYSAAASYTTGPEGRLVEARFHAG